MEVWSKRGMKRREKECAESGAGELGRRQTLGLQEYIVGLRYTDLTCYHLMKLLYMYIYICSQTSVFFFHIHDT